jgi:hypothetical protein
MIRVLGWLNKLCGRFRAIRGGPCQRITDKVEAIQVLREVRQKPDWNQPSRPHRGQLRGTTTLPVVPIHLGVSAAMAAFMGSRSVLPYSGFGRLSSLSSGAAFPTGRESAGRVPLGSSRGVAVYASALI